MGNVIDLDEYRRDRSYNLYRTHEAILTAMGCPPRLPDEVFPRSFDWEDEPDCGDRPGLAPTTIAVDRELIWYDHEYFIVMILRYLQLDDGGVVLVRQVAGCALQKVEAKVFVSWAEARSDMDDLLTIYSETAQTLIELPSSRHMSAPLFAA